MIKHAHIVGAFLNQLFFKLKMNSNVGHQGPVGGTARIPRGFDIHEVLTFGF